MSLMNKHKHQGSDTNTKKLNTMRNIRSLIKLNEKV